jgi:multimeric flavodoxin WrbA
MSVHLLGISGSPRPGATSTLVQAALLGAGSVTGTTTEYVPLAGRTIAGCNGCGPCLDAGHCVIDDDMQPLYDRLLAADGVILGSPVYFGSASALAKAFMERVEGFGVHDKKLRLKTCGAIAAGGSRNGGQETTQITINLWAHINDMLPVGITAPVSQWGATANTGFGRDDVDRDTLELKLTDRTISAKQIAWLYGRKLATVTRIVQAGIAATGLDLPDTPYGFSLPEAFPAELDAIGP